MKKLCTAIAVVFLSAAMLAAEQAQKIAGNWKVSMETPHGKMVGVFKIQQDGSKLSGTCETERHGSNPLRGTVDGSKVTLSVAMNDGHMTFRFNGTVDGAKMSGETEPNGATWTATRE